VFAAQYAQYGILSPKRQPQTIPLYVRKLRTASGDATTCKQDMRGRQALRLGTGFLHT
jgi:hypothetical protein